MTSCKLLPSLKTPFPHKDASFTDASAEDLNIRFLGHNSTYSESQCGRPRGCQSTQANGWRRAREKAGLSQPSAQASRACGLAAADLRFSDLSVCTRHCGTRGVGESFGFKEDLGKESVRWGKFQECICCFQEMTGSMVVNRVGGDTVGTVGGGWRDRSGHSGQNLGAGSRLWKPQARTRLIRVGFSKRHFGCCVRVDGGG